MKTFLKSFIQDETGASAAEYALILAVVGVGIVGAAITLQEAISSSMTQAAGIITTPSSGQ